MIRGIFWGLIICWIGFWIWLGNLYPQILAFRYSWPIIFTLLGVMGMVEIIQSAIGRSRKQIPHRNVGWRIFWALLAIVVGLSIWFSNVGWILGFSQWWPALVVVLGLTVIIRVIVHYANKPPRVSAIIDKLENGKIDVDEAVEEIRRTKRKGS